MRSLELPPTAADDLICAVLRRKPPASPRVDAMAASVLLERARFHGVGALLHERLAGSDWPRDLVAGLRTRAVQGAMWELAHQQVLAHTFEALAQIGVEPVLIKGTALAYDLYSDPALRSRGDTDLLIPVQAKQTVHDKLTSLGFKRHLGVSGEFVSYQASYTRTDPVTGSHTLDLHWKINNSELLSRLFTYEELRKDAQPLPHLCAHALGASRVHALLLACMHRATHKQNPYYVDGVAHYEADRLIWLYDIHLLAGRLTMGDWEQVAELAGAKGLRAVCLEGMRRARDCLGTPYPQAVMAALAAEPGIIEPPARYVEGGKLKQQWLDFLALEDWGQRLSFLRELILPPPGYMRQKYPEATSDLLAWLYVRRAAAGFTRRLAHQSARPDQR